MKTKPWWYGSFTSDAGFKGACYIQGGDAVAADFAAWKLAPVGTDQVMLIGPIATRDMSRNVPVGYRERLIAPGDEHLADSPFEAVELAAMGEGCGYEVHVHGKGVVQ